MACLAPLWLAVGSCGPELGGDAPYSEGGGAEERVATTRVALAEFEGYANPSAGEFSVQVVREFDVLPQLQAIYEGQGLRTVGQASSLGGPGDDPAPPAPWCLGRVVNDGRPGSGDVGTFELYTDPDSIASSRPFDPIPPQCNVGDDTSLFQVRGVFCATVRAMNFNTVSWAEVHAQLYSFTGANEYLPYSLGLGTSAATRDELTGALLPQYSNLPDPGDQLAVWRYGNLAARGGAAAVAWTFENGTDAGGFTFRGRVLGQVAEDCATAVNEDCDPLGRGDNGCRVYAAGARCTADADCVSAICSSEGFCADGCAEGRWGPDCEACPGGVDTPCSGHGVCNDGPAGDGTCACVPGHFGTACEVACAPGEVYDAGVGCTTPPGCAEGTLDVYGDASVCLDTVRIAKGDNHACAIVDGGDLYCWGYNYNGQLGLADTQQRTLPVRVGTETGWTDVAAGGDHTCGVREGELYCWGANFYSQLGDGTTSTRTSPWQIGARADWTQVSTGRYHTCGIANGELYCWGYNGYGHLGDETTTSRDAPTPVGSRNDWERVSAGEIHTCGIANGELYCWGYNNFSQLGDGTTTSRNTPTRIGSFSDWTHVSLGWNSSFAIRAGELYGWGLNDGIDYFLGDGSEGNRNAPTRIGEHSDWQSISGGGLSACGIRAGAAYCWGKNGLGELGTGEATASRPGRTVTPTPPWTAVSAGANHTCGIAAGELSCVGSDSGYGLLGRGNTLSSRIAVPVGGSGWTQVDAGDNYSCAIRMGNLYCWGRRFEGQLGLGDLTISAWVPTQVGSLSGWTRVAAGDQHTCGIREGALSCWGANGSGQLGIGDTTQRVSPEPVDVHTGWTAVDAGYFHTCGIRDGDMYCWGLNDNYQLANTGGNSSVPSPVGDSGPDWTHVAVGYTHSCGVRGGQLYCWGAGDAGQLGNNAWGTGTRSETPVQVGAGGTWTSVSTFFKTTCGVRDGELYCWGDASQGTLGTGTTSGLEATPVRVGGGNDWQSVHVGYYVACGVRLSGTQCWGAGGYSIARLFSPVPVPVRFGAGEDGAPAQVTGLVASTDRFDGVRLTWTAVDGATGYQVSINDGAWQAVPGAAPEYLDTAAPTPTVTPCAVYTDGTSTAAAMLRCDGGSALGQWRLYRVRAVNDAGAGAPSVGMMGRRTAGAITYQWERSSGDANSGFTALAGQTSATLSDTTINAGDPRYYRVVVNAVNPVTPATSNAVRNARYFGGPTGLTASTDRVSDVRLTWAAVPNAPGYEVQVNGLGWVPVATNEYLDTAAPPVTNIVPCTSVSASDGTSQTQISLSCTGLSYTNPASRTYTVRVASPWSLGWTSHTGGRRTVLVQWQRGTFSLFSGWSFSDLSGVTGASAVTTTHTSGDYRVRISAGAGMPDVYSTQNYGYKAGTTALGAACTSSQACVPYAWCPTNTANRSCSPRPLVGGTEQMPFQYVPAGTYTMGSPTAELGRSSDEAQHPVTLTRNFFVGRTEVTQGQWKALSGGVNPSCFQSTSGTSCSASNANDAGPVERVDWYSAVAYANALSAAEGLSACYTLSGCTDPSNGWKDGFHSGCTGATFVGPSCTGYRLLTESEWEYAARAGTTTATYAGNLASTVCSDTTLPAIAWFCGNAGSRTQAVAQKTPNGWGLYDMLGNVWEWTSDWYDTYPGSVTNPTGPASGSYRVLRGGSWNFSAQSARAAKRHSTDPGYRYHNNGFRLARSLP